MNAQTQLLPDVLRDIFRAFEQDVGRNNRRALRRKLAKTPKVAPRVMGGFLDRRAVLVGCLTNYSEVNSDASWPETRREEESGQKARSCFDLL
jgi:hypothetical protein